LEGSYHGDSLVELTLFLAYAGDVLPTLLMFSLGQRNDANFVKFVLGVEETVRASVGSLGLIAAHPLTTAIATCFLFGL